MPPSGLRPRGPMTCAFFTTHSEMIKAEIALANEKEFIGEHYNDSAELLPYACVKDLDATET